MQSMTLNELEARALDLRKAVGACEVSISDTLAARGDRLTPVGADDVETRQAIEALYSSDLTRLERSKAETESALAETEAAIIEARKGPARERRAVAQERMTALVARHVKARLDVQGYAERLNGAIGELHSAERELAAFLLDSNAPRSLTAGGLRHRLESIGWLLREWFHFEPLSRDNSVNVPFEERCRRLLVDLEFTDDQGKIVI